MIIMSRIHDERINSTNLYVEMTFGEYIKIADKLIGNNNLQRNRVKTSKTIYSLLKNDLMRGCVMPPIVLAVTSKAVSKDNTNEEIVEYISKNLKDVLILDGLQRTYTILDAAKEVGEEKREAFNDYKLRLEIYIDINKFGVLYRMLTLNTGQTPMSARHQLEMLYSDMLDTEIEGIKLITEVQGKADADDNEFIFRNAVDGFNSYLNRDELPMDRQELLENVKMLENMSMEGPEQDIFKEFLETYFKLFIVLREITADKTVTDEELIEYEIIGSPFGKKVSKVFSTSQSLTGFAAAIGIMKDKEIITGFDDIINTILEIKEKEKSDEWFMLLLKKMDIIRSKSKKIGNAQRMFFKYFYRELLNPESDSYQKLEEAVENGFKKYDSQVN